MIDAGALTDMQATLTDSLPDTGVIKRVTRTSDGMGGFTDAFAAVGTAVVRIGPMQPRDEAIVSGRLGADTAWVLTFPNGTDVVSADRVVVGSRTFDVTFAVVRSWEIDRRVYAKEVT